MAGIPIGSSFQMGAPLPLDDREYKDTMEILYSLPSYLRYEGMQTFVKETGTVYYLKGGIANSNWSVLGDGSSSKNSIPKVTSPISGDILIVNSDGNAQDSGKKISDLLDKATYDTDNDGIVDNTKKLNGHDDTYFAKAIDIPTKVSQLSNDSNFAKIDDTATTGNLTSTYSADKVVGLINGIVLILQDWKAGVKYKQGQLVSYLGKLYRAKVDIASAIVSPDINPTEFETFSSGTGGSSSNAVKFPSFTPNYTYSYAETINYNGLLYASKQSFTSGASFSIADWNLIGGDIKSSVVDTNNNGIIDHAEYSDVAQLALETTLISEWKPNTNYIINQNLVYLNKIYTVIKDHKSPATFSSTDTNLKLTATGQHNELLGIQGGVANQYYHLDQTHYNYVNKISETNGAFTYNGATFGDMIRLVYDKDGDGIVDKAATLNGLQSSITELNYLKGVTGNIQTQINSLSGSINLKDTHMATKATLLALTGMQKGDAYIIDADETKNGAQTWYTWNSTSWVFISSASVTARDFSLNPLDINLESTGILTENRIDNTIARKSDIPNISNLTLLQTYTQSDSDIANSISSSHSHSNKALLDSYNQTNGSIANAVSQSHTHVNKTVLDKFSEDSSGNPLYSGKTIVGSSGGGGGISDLSNFTTDDLKESTSRYYVTASEKANIQNLANIVNTQASMNTTLNTITQELPSDVSATNKLITTNAVNDKVNNMKFINLKDVDNLIKPNSFVITDSTGIKVTYKQSIKDLILINKITDKDGLSFTDIPMLQFDDMSGTLKGDGTLELKMKNLFTTNLKDMPTTFTDNSVLVANASKQTYELKDIATLTNSHENKVFNVLATDWFWSANDNCYMCEIVHNLSSTSLVIGKYDNFSNEITNVFTKIENSNAILLKCQTQQPCKIVINCSQGTIGSGDGTNGGTMVTASDFIDDTRVRSDKTYSSQNIVNTLKSYAQVNLTYSKAQSDSLFASKTSEHIHDNLDVLKQLTSDTSQNLYFAGQKLLLNFQPNTYQLKWMGESRPTQTTLVDVNSIYINNKINAIMNSEFTIKNNITSVNETEDNKPTNQIHLVIIDNTIKILDVYIKPSEANKYILGISPNVSIMITGTNFDAIYTMTSY